MSKFAMHCEVNSRYFCDTDNVASELHVVSKQRETHAYSRRNHIMSDDTRESSCWMFDALALLGFARIVCYMPSPLLVAGNFDGIFPYQPDNRQRSEDRKREMASSARRGGVKLCVRPRLQISTGCC